MPRRRLWGPHREQGCFVEFCACFSADGENISPYVAPFIVETLGLTARKEAACLSIASPIDRRLCAYPQSSPASRHRVRTLFLLVKGILSRFQKVGMAGIAQCRRIPPRNRRLQLPRRYTELCFPPRA